MQRGEGRGRGRGGGGGGRTSGRFGPVPAATLSLVGRENPASQQRLTLGALGPLPVCSLYPLTRPELIVESPRAPLPPFLGPSP